MYCLVLSLIYARKQDKLRDSQLTSTATEPAIDGISRAEVRQRPADRRDIEKEEEGRKGGGGEKKDGGRGLR